MVAKIVVVGAGIIGVSSAYCIQNAFPEAEVTVIAKTFSPNTTSDGAAGLWEPYLAGGGSVKKWSKETYDFVTDLLKNDTTSCLAGLSFVHGFTVSKAETIEIPYWSEIPYDFQVLPKSALKRFPEYIRSAFSFTTVFLEGSKFIPWLSKKFIDLGGKFMKKEVKSLGELSGRYDIIVNCVGLNAKDLINDDEVYPIRGQIARVKAPWIKEFIMLTEASVGRSTYILPNQDFVVLGGTCNINDDNTSVNQDDKEWILSSCQDFFPSLEHAEHLLDWVGLRPGRDQMRVEKEDIILNNNTKLKVVHNYGHGGSGLTVHRGCALEALQLVTECILELNLLKSKI